MSVIKVLTMQKQRRGAPTSGLKLGVDCRAVFTMIDDEIRSQQSQLQLGGQKVRQQARMESLRNCQTLVKTSRPCRRLSYRQRLIHCCQ